MFQLINDCECQKRGAANIRRMRGLSGAQRKIHSKMLNSVEWRLLWSWFSVVLRIGWWLSLIHWQAYFSGGNLFNVAYIQIYINLRPKLKGMRIILHPTTLSLFSDEKTMFLQQYQRHWQSNIIILYIRVCGIEVELILYSNLNLLNIWMNRRGFLRYD